MLKIGDFSRLGQVTVRTLRYYDRLGLLKPTHVDTFTGYRYYQLEQLPRLHRILVLKNLGFSLDEIAALLPRDLGPGELHGMLLAKRAEIEREVQENLARLDRVAMWLRLIEREGDTLEDYEIVVKPVPGFTVASMRSLIPTIDAVGRYCDAHFIAIREWLKAAGADPMGQTINFYHMDEYRETDIDMESGVVLDAAHKVTRQHPTLEGIRVHRVAAVEQMASLIQLMTFNTLPEYAVMLLKWIVLSGYEIAGPMREIHLFGDPVPVSADARLIMELQVPVRRSDRPAG